MNVQVVQEGLRGFFPYPDPYYPISLGVERYPWPFPLSSSFRYDNNNYALRRSGTAVEKPAFRFLWGTEEFYRHLGQAVLEVATPQQLQVSCRGSCFQTFLFLEGGSPLTHLFYKEAVGAGTIVPWEEIHPLALEGYELLQWVDEVGAEPLFKWLRLLLEEGAPGRYVLALRDRGEFSDPRRYLRAVVGSAKEALHRYPPLPLLLRERGLEHLTFVLFSPENPIYFTIFHGAPLQRVLQDSLHLENSPLALPGVRVEVRMRK